jgi:uncharacterized protein DUF6335
MTKNLNPDPITVSVSEIADTGELLEELDAMREADKSQSPELSAGDVDARWDEAESSGDETAGGSSPTPDQEVVDEIGKAIGVTYQEGEPLRVGDKEEDRDKHRWELDPASAEDYMDRLHEQFEAEPIMKMEHTHHVKKTS